MVRKRTQTKPASDGQLTLLKAGERNYPDHPDKARIEAFPNRYRNRNYWVEFDCPEFTAICPVTGQPDFGHITIRYIPDKLCVESKSLKLYMFSFRNHGTFHEEVVNRIRDDIVGAVRPRKLEVRGAFNPRGGISIQVETSYP